MIEGLTPDQEKDLESIHAFFEKCEALFVERASKYGSSWRQLSPSSISDLIKMKADRATKTNEPMDLANYAAMLFIRLTEQGND